MPKEVVDFCASNGIRSVVLWNYAKSAEGERWYRLALTGLVRAAKRQVPGRSVNRWVWNWQFANFAMCPWFTAIRAQVMV